MENIQRQTLKIIMIPVALLVIGIIELLIKYVFYWHNHLDYVSYNAVCFILNLLFGLVIGSVYFWQQSKKNGHFSIHYPRLFVILIPSLILSAYFIFFFKDNYYFISQHSYTLNYIYLDNNDFMEIANHLSYILSGFLLLSVFYKKETDEPKNIPFSNWIKCFCVSAGMILLLFIVNYYMRNMEHFEGSKWGISFTYAYVSLTQLRFNYEIYQAVLFITNIIFGTLIGFLMYFTRQNKKITRNLSVKHYLKNGLPAFIISLIPFIVIAIFYNSKLYNEFFNEKLASSYHFIGNISNLLYFFIFSDFMQAFQIIFGYWLFTYIISKISTTKEQ